MNLMTNARDALNERYQGYHEDKVMRLSCCLFEADGRRWLRIVVEDHGAGIPDDVKEKIFEPFFSTKPKEMGTGLGLSISYGIVKDHHGSLTLNSMQGEKTEAILVLPVDNGWTL
jgi:signal transduction histidine kinase